MEISEFIQLTQSEKVKNLKFDGYDLEIEFDSGISVTVNHETDWDSSVWAIESSIEAEQQRLKWERQEKEEIEAKRVREEYQTAILSKFPKEQWPEIRATFK